MFWLKGGKKTSSGVFYFSCICGGLQALVKAEETNVRM